MVQFEHMTKHITYIKFFLRLWIVYIVLLSCSSHDYGFSFPLSICLKGEYIPLDTILLQYPFRIRVNHDRVVIQDLHPYKHFFHLFSYPEFSYLSSFGEKGDGPNEFLQAENFRWQGDSLLTLDCYKAEIRYWRFNTNRDSLQCCGIETVIKNLSLPLDFVQCDSNNFLIPDYSGNSRLCKVNKNGEILERIKTIPTSKKKALQTNPNIYAQGWRCYMDYNKQNEILVIVTQLGEVLEIYNLATGENIIKKGKYGEPKIRRMNEYAIPNGIIGFSDIQVTDNYIYTIFEGHKYDEIVKKWKQGERTPQGGNLIRVYDLRGEPTCEYHLDHHINGIHVNENKKIILAVDANSNNPVIEYKIK